MTAFALATLTLLTTHWACKAGPGASALNADATYAGSIRVSLGAATDTAQAEYRLNFATSLSVQRLGICVLKKVGTAAACRVGDANFFETEVVRETATRRYFKAKSVAVLQDNLILVLQGLGTSGAVVDTRIVKFNSRLGPDAGQTAGTAGDAGAGKSYETKGSGGKTGAYDGTFGQGGRFKMVAASDNSLQKSHGLLIFLHGSTASSYEEFAQANASVAAANGLMSVSVLAPNGQGWNESDSNEAALYLDGLLKNVLFKQYNVDKRKIFFHGQSSGSGFLSSHFVALYGKDYGGGALMLCGASPPQASFVAPAEMKKRFRLYYDLTVDDGIWTDQLAPAVAAYRAAGLTVETTSEGNQQKPGGHCQFDQQAILAEKLPAMIKANGTP